MGHSYPEAGGIEHYCRPADAPGGSHMRPSLVTMASCGALYRRRRQTLTFSKNAFAGFLVTFEAKPLGWNTCLEGGGVQVYSNPGMQQLKLAAAAVAMSKIRRTYPCP